MSRTPFGSFPPNVENFSGFLRNSTISSNSLHDVRHLTKDDAEDSRF